MKDNKVLIRAEIMGENAGGQKLIHLLANNADGIEFWTDDKSLMWPSDYERTEELKEEAKNCRVRRLRQETQTNQRGHMQK